MDRELREGSELIAILERVRMHISIQDRTDRELREASELISSLFTSLTGDSSSTRFPFFEKYMENPCPHKS